MRNFLLFLSLVLFLSGCATYKFQKSTASGAQGYLAYYDDKPIIEYTVGKEKSLPDLNLAKERFKRRKSKVEFYYKQMGQIESRLKEMFWEPPSMIVGFLGGVLNWPFRAAADYKYNHNPGYKAKVDRLDEEKETLEAARIAKLKKELDVYVAEDLAQETGVPAIVETKPEPKEELPKVMEPVVAVKPVAQSAPVVPPAAAKAEPVVAPVAEPVMPVSEPVAIKHPAAEEVPAAKPAPEPPVAVIIAKPARGYSPLKVAFSAQKSYSRAGKIVSYAWDFGDGDTSTQKNPENTYWSTTFGPRNFTVTLTVSDQAGSVSSTTSVIEVITR
ncbi:MAG: PKD domain-containing protein [Candidatus Omnitrophica bacterium]|nr:PKD domain-containing protein [Candidatus Omnitrophota bacterium]